MRKMANILTKPHSNTLFLYNSHILIKTYLKFAPWWCNSHPWPLLLTWFNFNPSMGKYYMPGKVRDEITYPFPNFNGGTVEIKEWNFIPQIIMSVITYPCWDWSSTMLEKGVPGIIGSNDRWAPKRRKTITWTRVSQFTDAYLRHQTLSSLIAPSVVILTTFGATIDGKVGIMTTFGFKCI